MPADAGKASADQDSAQRPIHRLRPLPRDDRRTVGIVADQPQKMLVGSAVTSSRSTWVVGVGAMRS